MAEYTLHADGDNKALRDAIFKATPKAVEQMKTMSQKFKGTTDIDTCKNIWNFLKTNIRYVADGNHQKVKLPSALLREKVGDCKSFSLFTAAILQNLNIPWHYVLSSYTNDPTPQHIYVVCDSGIIVDAVWIAFNQEKKPNFRYKHKVNNNDMRISYIAGIPAKRKTIFGCSPNCRCAPCRTRVGTNGIRGTSTMMSGNSRMLGTESKFMGIGRTGIDWLKAATGREATWGESTEYFLKNRTLLPVRKLFIEFIENNGGGIANFLYNAWLRNEPYILPNQKKYNAEYEALYKQIISIGKYPLVGRDFVFTEQEKAALGASLISNQGGPAQALDLSAFGKEATNKVKQVVTVQQALSPARYKMYTDYMDAQKIQKAELQIEVKKIYAELDKKYPLNTRQIYPATDKSRQKYRDIELVWFWKLGGSPDDLNNAVKEGNTKSPRGKDANYMLMKAAADNLSFKDIGLVIRGFVSAFGGDKFGLGDDGTFTVLISGMRQKNVGIGITVEAIVTAYIVPITAGLTAILPILGALGVFGKAEEEGGEGGGGNEGGNGGQGGGGGGDEADDNTTMYLILGAVAVGGFLLLNK